MQPPTRGWGGMWAGYGLRAMAVCIATAQTGHARLSQYRDVAPELRRLLQQFTMKLSPPDPANPVHALAQTLYGRTTIRRAYGHRS